MNLIADILLAAGAIGAAIYCLVLAGRLKRFNNLQNGVGGAVAVLSAQVDDMTKTLQKAQKAAISSSVTLTSLTERAEDVSQRLELMLASMHDLSDGAEDNGPAKSADATQTADIRQGESHPDAPAQRPDDVKSNAPLFLSKRQSVMEAAE